MQRELTHDKIVEIINQEINRTGYMPLSSLKRKLKDNGASQNFLNSFQAKEWISSNFPEFTVVGTLGYARIVDLKKDDLLRVLLEQLVDAGEHKLLFAELPKLLQEKGLGDWKARAGEKKIYEWITSEYPSVFEISDDKHWLILRLNQKSLQNFLVDQDTLKVVYSLCFFPQNTALLRRVKELIDEPAMKQQEWAERRTFSFVQSLLGLNGGIFYDRKKDKIAFCTGLKTPQNQDVYGVLVRNIEGARQKWKFDSVSFPGEDTEEGSWLCKTFGIKSQASYSIERTSARDALVETLLKIREANEALSGDLPSMEEKVSKGECFSESESDTIRDYIKEWDRMREIIKSLGENDAERLVSIDSIEVFLNKLDDSNSILEKLKKKYEQLVRRTWLFLKDYSLCKEDRSADDISSWNEKLKENVSYDLVEELRRQLSPCQSIKVLHDSPCGTPKKNLLDAMDVVDNHYGTSLSTRLLNRCFRHKDADMDFLRLIPEIEELIKQIETSVIQVSREKGEQCEPDESDSGLLAAALNGTLWELSNKVFREPNSLVTAIMLGDTEKVLEITSNPSELHAFGYEDSCEERLIEKANNLQFDNRSITPLHAAERLRQFTEELPEASRLIEQCLLLGVSVREENAADELVKLYKTTDRPSLALDLLESSAVSVTSESQQQITLELVQDGLISLADAVDKDVLYFLTPAGLDVVRSSSDGVLKDSLERLYPKIQPTLIHDIVFLSPELQSYVLQPENANELEKADYGPDARIENFRELIINDSYERGTAPLQIAKRLYDFFGTWNDLAYDFALCASESDDRRRLLFELLRERGNDQDVIRFLAQNPDIWKEKGNRAYCLDLMFRNQKYEEICNVLSDIFSLSDDVSVKESLQYFFAQIKSGYSIDSLPQFGINEAQALKEKNLLLDISDELSQHNQSLHKVFLKQIFGSAVRTFANEELTRLVTGSGRLSEKVLREMENDESIRRDHVVLAIYCARILKDNEKAFDYYRDELYQRYNSINRLSEGAEHFDEQIGLIHELCILYPDECSKPEYSNLKEGLLKQRLSSLLSQEITKESKAEEISKLLNESDLDRETLDYVIRKIGDNEVFCCKPLYETIHSLTKEDSRMISSFFEKASSFWESGEREFHIFFCEKVIEAEECDLIPVGELSNYESYILQTSDSLDGNVFQNCILRIEESKKREPYLSFVQFIIEISNRKDQFGILTVDDFSREISWLCQALEDNSIEIEEYLDYCGRLVASLPKVSDEFSATGYGETLRELYQDCRNSDNWSAVEKMIPQKNSKARACALYYRARYFRSKYMTWNRSDSGSAPADSEWERCVMYCLTESLDDLFFKSIGAWLQQIKNGNILTPNSVLYYTNTLQKVLEDSDKDLQKDPSARFPEYGIDASSQLMRSSIDLFNRISEEQNYANRNFLRVIIEMCLHLDCEDILIEDLGEKLGESYYASLGLVAVSRLLLKNDIRRARQLLKRIMTIHGDENENVFYYPLMKKLAAKSEDELKEWLSETGNLTTLRFVLPTGAPPNILRLQALVMSAYEVDEGKQNDCVYVIEELIGCFPDHPISSALYKSLFVVCKENYRDYLPTIYKALVGAYKNYSPKDNLNSRSQFQILKLIEILRLVMQDLGLVELFEDSNTLFEDYQQGQNGSKEDLGILSHEIETLLSDPNISRDLLIESLLGSVTDNWAPFFRRAYEQRITHLARDYCVGKYGDTFFKGGILRGTLRVWRELELEQSNDHHFLDWIEERIEEELKEPWTHDLRKSLMGDHRLVSEATDGVDFSSVNWKMLRLPWEEKLVCFGNEEEDKNRSEINTCFKVMLTERPKGCSAETSFMYVLRLAQVRYKTEMLKKSASEWFDKGYYDLAGDAYRALFLLRFVPSGSCTDERERAEAIEKNRIWACLSRAFAGRSIPENSSRSCLNMMCELINNGYERFFDRLINVTSFITYPQNQRLFYTVRSLLAAKVRYDVSTGREILESLANLSAPGRNRRWTPKRVFLEFLLSKPDAGGQFFFISDNAFIREVSDEIRDIDEVWRQNFVGAVASPTSFKDICFSLTRLPERSIFESPAPVIEEFGNSSSSPSSADVASSTNGTRPQFLEEKVKKYKSGENDIEPSELIKEYKKINPAYDGDYKERLRISARICSEEGSEEENWIRFGINYFRSLDSKNNEKGVDIHKDILDFAVYYSQTKQVFNDQGINIQVRELLPKLFLRSVMKFGTIGDLLRDYLSNPSGYKSMKDLALDTPSSDDVDLAFAVLGELRMESDEVMEDSCQSALKVLTSVLNNGQDESAKSYGARLSEFANDLQNKLENAIVQTPKLVIDVLNENIENRLYGEVRNEGHAEVKNLTLSVSFTCNGRDALTPHYSFPILKPGGSAAFAVKIERMGNEGGAELRYNVILRYSGKDGNHRFMSEPGVLSRGDCESSGEVVYFEERFPCKYHIEEGCVVSEKADFVERTSEIKELTNLVKGDVFSDYGSAIVTGIKRSGKTTLLNYLQTYVRAYKSDNTMVVKIDCQNFRHSISINKIFFKSVCDGLKNDYSEEIEKNSKWTVFLTKWQLDGNNGDIDNKSENMLQFYRELKSVLGKGLFIIVDEIDVLLDHLNKNESDGYRGLFGALRAIMSDNDSQLARMVLCGSNNLLHYINTDTLTFCQFSQIFERIKVGELEYCDIKEMIDKWLNKNQVVHFVKSKDGGVSPSFQWLWHCTGGLVWYARLIANKAARTVLKEKRNCVYPYDVCLAAKAICNDNVFCGTLLEGINVNDMIVLDVLQSLAVLPNSFITYNQLRDQLQKDRQPVLSDEQINSSLSRLTDVLKFIEKSESNSYRFRIDFYRCYFRSLSWEKSENRYRSMFTNETYGESYGFFDEKK